MEQDFSIWQGVGRGRALATISLCPALHVQDHMLIPAGQQLLKPCLSLGVWFGASYLMFLSLNFLIIEMAMSMQRTWCQATGARGCPNCTGYKARWRDPWKDFLPAPHM